MASNATIDWDEIPRLLTSTIGWMPGSPVSGGDLRAKLCDCSCGVASATTEKGQQDGYSHGRFPRSPTSTTVRIFGSPV